MGWGEQTGRPELSVSQQITQRSIERGAAAQLARAVRAFTRVQSAANFADLEAALAAYDAAHQT